MRQFTQSGTGSDEHHHFPAGLVRFHHPMRFANLLKAKHPGWLCFIATSSHLISDGLERYEHGRRQPNVPIHSATARPISSGESSWTKWIPATVFSVSAGLPRTRLTSVSLARIAPGSAFRNSLGTLLVPSQSAYSVAIAWTSAGSPAMGI